MRMRGLCRACIPSLTYYAFLLMTAPNIALDELRHEYQENGYIIVRQLFASDDVAAWRDECDRLLTLDQYIDPLNLRTLPKMTTDGEPIVERFDPLIDISPVFKSLAEDRRLLDIVEALFDDQALLFKDKLIFKLPKTKGYGLHQDWGEWQPFPAPDLLSVMVAIDGADASNGALYLHPGYHDRYLGKGESIRSQVDPATRQLVDTQPGDVVIFHSLAPHGSGDNTSSRSRRQFYPTFCAARHGNLYEAHYQHIWGNRRREKPQNQYFFK